MQKTDTAKIMRAAGLVLARQAQRLAEDAATAANDVIDLAPVLRAWRAGSYAAGAVAVHNGMPYRCVQAHDSTQTPEWTPVNAPALWAPYHATDAAHALPWQAPTGAQDAYRQGEWMLWEGALCECTAESTVWAPDVRPEDWREEDDG